MKNKKRKWILYLILLIAAIFLVASEESSLNVLGSLKLNRLAACLFGVVLGALYCKTYNQHKDAKDGSGKSINTEAGDLYSEMENDKKIIMKKIKKDISETEVPNKNLVLKMAGNCVAFLKDPMTIELPETIGSSQELGEIAYALVDQKLEGDPFPLVDIFITSSLFRAIAVTG